MPDGRSVVIQANDGTSVGVWIQPLDGPATKVATGTVVLESDLTVSRSGQMAFLASEPDRPSELYFLPAPAAPLQRLTDFNAAIAALELGKVEPLRWRGADNFEMDGVLTFPPGYQAGRTAAT